MQLCDVFEETDAVEEAILEMRFQSRLKWLNTRSEKTKKELLSELNDYDFSFSDLKRLYGE